VHELVIIKYNSLIDYLQQQSDTLVSDKLVLHKLRIEGRKKPALETDICEHLLLSVQIFVYINLTTVYSEGHAVAQLVEALSYKSEGRGFDS
jgi:hypothetical protein